MKKYDDMIDIEEYCAFIGEIDEDDFLFDVEAHCTKDLDYTVLEEVLYTDNGYCLILKTTTLSINPVDLMDVSQ